MRAQEELIEWDKLQPLLNQLKDASSKADSELIQKLLIKIVPEFKPQTRLT